jgi:Rnl2 family RNA ligase
VRFRSYPKIGGSAEGGGTWVATEKIHGANFVIGVSGETVNYGKRKAWIEPDEPFFGWQLIATDLAERCRAVAKGLAAQVVCFGELYGGGYPAVPPIAGLAPIQTGIWYAPEIHWAGFDVLVARDDEDEGELIAFSDAEKLFTAAGLHVAPVLGRGKRDDLERIKISAPTAVPAWFGLPAIENNLREGFVLKPDRAFAAGARPILKRKLADFDDARFDEGPGWQPGHLSEAELISWAERLVNPARVASARSKVGTAPAKIVDEIVLDVAVDLETVFAAAWRALDADGEARVLAAVRAKSENALS